MGAPGRGDATSTAQIEITWTELVAEATGGSPITSYHLEWDDGVNGFQSLQGGPDAADYSLDTSHIISSGIVSGAAYTFRLQARNIHGWGEYSVVTTIAAASTPDAPNTVVTSIENIYVRFDWNEPQANSAVIDGYDVYIIDSDGTYVRESTYCDGFTNDVVLNEQYCLVPMSVLQGETYGLVLGELIRAKVRAHNSYGYGDYSGVNSFGVSI